MHVEKNGSDEISGGTLIGPDTFQNGSDIIHLKPCSPYKDGEFATAHIFTYFHQFVQ